jgi:hypothetical protein
MATKTEYGSTQTNFGTTTTIYGVETVTIEGNEISDNTFDANDHNIIENATTAAIGTSTGFEWVPEDGITYRVLSISARARHRAGSGNLTGAMYNVVTPAATSPAMGGAKKQPVALPQDTESIEMTGVFSNIVMAFDSPVLITGDGVTQYTAVVHGNAPTSVAYSADNAGTVVRKDTNGLQDTFTQTGSASEELGIWWDVEEVSGIALTGPLTSSLTSSLTSNLTG